MKKSWKIGFVVVAVLFVIIIFSCANSGEDIKPEKDDTSTEETTKGEEENSGNDTPEEVKPTYEEWTKIGKAEFSNTRDRNESGNDIIKRDEAYTTGIKVDFSGLPSGIKGYNVYVYEFGKGGEIFWLNWEPTWSLAGINDDNNGYFIFPYLKASQKYHFCFVFINDADEIVLWDEIECTAGKNSLGEIEVEIGNETGMNYNEYGDLIFKGIDSINIKLNNTVLEKNNIVGIKFDCFNPEWKWLFHFVRNPSDSLKSLNLYENVPDWCDLYREPKDMIDKVKSRQTYFWIEDEKTWEYTFDDTAIVVVLDNPKLKTLEDWRESMGVTAPTWEKLSLDNISRFEGIWEWNHIWVDGEEEKYDYDYFSFVIDKDGKCLYKQVFSQFLGTSELSGKTVEASFNLKDRITVPDEDFYPRDFEIFGDTNIRALLREDDLRPTFTRYVEK